MGNKPRYTFEECQEIAKKYDSYDIFKEEQKDIYKYIKGHCWCTLLCSHMSRINKRLKYNIDEVKEIIKKYKTLKEFRIKEPKAYGSVIRHKDRWLLKDLLPSENSYNRWIYAYEFKELNKVYVGLTWNVEKRHGQHRIKGTVHKFLKEHNIEELPHPLIVEGPVAYDKAGERERFWMDKYLSDKWELINISDAGSLGGDTVGNDVVAVFKINGEFIECTSVKKAAEKYSIKRNLIRLVMSGRNKSTNGLRFFKEDEWIQMGKPNKIDSFNLLNKEEEIVLLDGDLNVRQVVKNKVAAAEYEGYTQHNINNNIFMLRHHLILNTKNGGKCAYYDDYEKFKRNEWIIVKPEIHKCKTLLLLPKDYTEDDVKKLLAKPLWWENRSRKRSLQRRTNPMKIINRNLTDKTVQQFSLDGILLNEYKNPREAAKKNNICVHALHSCLSCKSYTSGGYIWLYKETFMRSILEEKIAAAKRMKEREAKRKIN